MHTESLPLVQGRGRWNDIRVMRIYLQEMQSTTFITKQTAAAQRRIKSLDLSSDRIWTKS